jgi:glucokinase
MIKLRAKKGESSMAIIGIDLGGRALRIGIIEDNSKGKLSLQGSVEEHSSPRSWEEFLQVLGSWYKRKAEASKEGCGIAIAGVIENHAKVVKAPNLPWLDGRNVPKELAPHLRLKPAQIVVSNDMEAAAHGENAMGIIKENEWKWVIFDTISTGWGGALILNGEVVVGEPGHVNLGFDLPYVCGCGNRGCLEALYSGSAMERRILQQFQKQVEEQKLLFPPDLNIWDYFHKELESKAQWAVTLLEEWAEGVGRAWANVLNRIRRIQAIVYMGTTAENLVPKAMAGIRATMRRICMFPEHKDPKFPIEPAKEPNRSIYGAVLVYQQEKEGGEKS